MAFEHRSGNSSASSYSESWNDSDEEITENVELLTKPPPLTYHDIKDRIQVVDASTEGSWEIQQNKRKHRPRSTQSLNFCENSSVLKATKNPKQISGNISGNMQSLVRQNQVSRKKHKQLEVKITPQLVQAVSDLNADLFWGKGLSQEQVSTEIRQLKETESKAYEDFIKKARGIQQGQTAKKVATLQHSATKKKNMKTQAKTNSSEVSLEPSQNKFVDTLPKTLGPNPQNAARKNKSAVSKYRASVIKNPASASIQQPSSSKNQAAMSMFQASTSSSVTDKPKKKANEVSTQGSNTKQKKSSNVKRDNIKEKASSVTTAYWNVVKSMKSKANAKNVPPQAISQTHQSANTNAKKVTSQAISQTHQSANTNAKKITSHATSQISQSENKTNSTTGFVSSSSVRPVKTKNDNKAINEEEIWKYLSYATGYNLASFENLDHAIDSSNALGTKVEAKHNNPETSKSLTVNEKKQTQKPSLETGIHHWSHNEYSAQIENAQNEPVLPCIDQLKFYHSYPNTEKVQTRSDITEPLHMNVKAVEEHWKTRFETSNPYTLVGDFEEAESVVISPNRSKEKPSCKKGKTGLHQFRSEGNHSIPGESVPADPHCNSQQEANVPFSYIPSIPLSSSTNLEIDQGSSNIVNLGNISNPPKLRENYYFSPPSGSNNPLPSSAPSIFDESSSSVALNLDSSEATQSSSPKKKKRKRKRKKKNADEVQSGLSSSSINTEKVEEFTKDDISDVTHNMDQFLTGVEIPAKIKQQMIDLVRLDLLLFWPPQKVFNIPAKDLLAIYEGCRLTTPQLERPCSPNIGTVTDSYNFRHSQIIQTKKVIDTSSPSTTALIKETLTSDLSNAPLINTTLLENSSPVQLKNTSKRKKKKRKPMIVDTHKETQNQASTSNDKKMLSQNNLLEKTVCNEEDYKTQNSFEVKEGEDNMIHSQELLLTDALELDLVNKENLKKQIIEEFVILAPKLTHKSVFIPSTEILHHLREVNRLLDNICTFSSNTSLVNAGVTKNSCPQQFENISKPQNRDKSEMAAVGVDELKSKQASTSNDKKTNITYSGDDLCATVSNEKQTKTLRNEQKSAAISNSIEDEDRLCFPNLNNINQSQKQLPHTLDILRKQIIDEFVKLAPKLTHNSAFIPSDKILDPLREINILLDNNICTPLLNTATSGADNSNSQQLENAFKRKKKKRKSKKRNIDINEQFPNEESTSNAPKILDVTQPQTVTNEDRNKLQNNEPKSTSFTNLVQCEDGGQLLRHDALEPALIKAENFKKPITDEFLDNYTTNQEHIITEQVIFDPKLIQNTSHPQINKDKPKKTMVSFNTYYTNQEKYGHTSFDIFYDVTKIVKKYEPLLELIKKPDTFRYFPTELIKILQEQRIYSPPQPQQILCKLYSVPPQEAFNNKLQSQAEVSLKTTQTTFAYSSYYKTKEKYGYRSFELFFDVKKTICNYEQLLLLIREPETFRMLPHELKDVLKKRNIYSQPNPEKALQKLSKARMEQTPLKMNHNIFSESNVANVLKKTHSSNEDIINESEDQNSDHKITEKDMISESKVCANNSPNNVEVEVRTDDKLDVTIIKKIALPYTDIESETKNENTLSSSTDITYSSTKENDLDSECDSFQTNLEGKVINDRLDVITTNGSTRAVSEMSYYSAEDGADHSYKQNDTVLNIQELAGNYYQGVLSNESKAFETDLEQELRDTYINGSSVLDPLHNINQNGKSQENNSMSKRGMIDMQNKTPRLVLAPSELNLLLDESASENFKNNEPGSEPFDSHLQTVQRNRESLSTMECFNTEHVTLTSQFVRDNSEEPIHPNSAKFVFADNENKEKTTQPVAKERNLQHEIMGEFLKLASKIKHSSFTSSQTILYHLQAINKELESSDVTQPVHQIDALSLDLNISDSASNPGVEIVLELQKSKHEFEHMLKEASSTSNFYYLYLGENFNKFMDFKDTYMNGVLLPKNKVNVSKNKFDYMLEEASSTSNVYYCYPGKNFNHFMDFKDMYMNGVLHRYGQS